MKLPRLAGPAAFAACLVLGAAPVRAQAAGDSVRAAPDSVRAAPDIVGAASDRGVQSAPAPPFRRLVLPAIIGSGAGALVGFHLGATFGIGGTAALGGALLGGAVGGVAMTAAGLYLSADEGESTEGIWPGSLVGLVGGVLGAYAFQAATGGAWDEDGVLLGFALGQGLMAAGIASVTR